MNIGLKIVNFWVHVYYVNITKIIFPKMKMISTKFLKNCWNYALIAQNAKCFSVSGQYMSERRSTNQLIDFTNILEDESTTKVQRKQSECKSKFIILNFEVLIYSHFPTFSSIHSF